ncbi:MAG: hypothetical protein KatS3mg057_0348 [Herpetosiphonaceae bacterium]|nr:MAG: hypothetical protein KatS3mg057_0348 [Herpetosiphonaceae bacterium]
MATIVGVFHEELEAEAVAEQLQLNFDNADVAVVTDWRELMPEEDSPVEGISGRLSLLGISEEFAPEYAERARRGEVLVVVRVSNDRLPTAQRLLRQAGPIDIDILPELKS